MGTGWRRAFCTTVQRDCETTISETKQPISPSPSPRSCAKLGLFFNPSTPRLQSQPVSSTSLRCRTTSTADDDDCKTRSTKPTKNKPLHGSNSNPPSPRSPSKLSLFRNSFRQRSCCGICLQSVKASQGMAIYTAECAHAFHFPCIASHVRKLNKLVCPVCNSDWKDVPLLAVHRNDEAAEQQPLVTRPDDAVTHIRTIRTVKTGENSREQLMHDESSPKKQYHRVRTKFLDVRSYDDDEPLLSPSAGAGFIAIPEANEDGEQVEETNQNYEDGEFHGFVVNPNPSCSIKIKSDGVELNNCGDMKNVEVSLMPETAVVSVGRGHETYALALRVKAPPLPASISSRDRIFDSSRRAAIDLVTVLDVSGSMSGTKLQMLKRAMRLVISSLSSADRLSIVAFSSTSKRLLPLRRMTPRGRRNAQRIVHRLACCGQGSSAGVALKQAAMVLEDRRERNPVASIILLSDGQDERADTKASNQRQGLSGSSTRFAHIEIPVRAYSHVPGEDAFAKCVGGLLSVVVQDLRIQLGLGSGSDPFEICGVYCCNDPPTLLSDSGSGTIRLGDLYAEEERELLVELKVPTTTSTGSHHVLSVRCRYKDPSTEEIVYGKDQSMPVHLAPAVRSSEQESDRMRNLLITARALAGSRRLTERGDYSTAQQLLSSSRALLVESPSLSADEYVRCLEGELQMIRRRRVSENLALVDENGEPLTPRSAWREAERLAKIAVLKNAMNRVGDLHGFENARF